MGRKGREKMGKIAKVQEVTLSQLVPYANNAKIHGPEQIEKLKASINEFGFLTPCLIDEDFNIIAGHGRVIAAKELGMDTVPCVFVEGLTDAQRRAYILADNRLGEIANWDENMVGLELGELSEMNFDIDILGFDTLDLNVDDFGTDFDLPTGDKPEICQMTFTLHQEQKELIERALAEAQDMPTDTFGNTNKNGNALYEVVRQWEEQRI